MQPDELQLRRGQKSAVQNLPHETLARAFLSERCVCPYARNALGSDQVFWARVDREACLNPYRSRAAYRSYLGSFLGSRRRILILELQMSFASHEEAHFAAKRIFCEMSIVAADSQGSAPDAEKIERAIVRRLYPALAHPWVAIADSTIPLSSADGQPGGALFSFMMNPLYDISHFRYAPTPMLVLTYVSDLALAYEKSPGVIEVIRQAVISRSGLSTSSFARAERTYDLAMTAQSDFAITRQWGLGLYVDPSVICDSLEISSTTAGP